MNYVPGTVLSTADTVQGKAKECQGRELETHRLLRTPLSDLFQLSLKLHLPATRLLVVSQSI